MKLIFKLLPNVIKFCFTTFLIISCNGITKKEEAKDNSSKTKNKKPNIILIYADDQGTLDAGCYGTEDIKTPNLDALASEGIKFTQAYAHTVCCPSRAGLLTGRAPQ